MADQTLELALQETISASGGVLTPPPDMNLRSKQQPMDARAVATTHGVCRCNGVRSPRMTVPGRDPRVAGMAAPRRWNLESGLNCMEVSPAWVHNQF